MRTALRTGLLLAVFLGACGGSGDTTLAPSAPRWIGLDPAAPEGSPARWALDPALCDDEQTVVDVEVPGLWLEARQGPDGRSYEHVRIPGLGRHDVPGAPDLPLLRLRLAVTTAAQTVELDDVVLEDVRVIPDVLVWPRTVLGEDHVGGHPEEFHRDEPLYASTADWPPSDGPPSRPVAPCMRSIPAARCEGWLCRWNPSTRELRVPGRVRYRYVHPGPLRDFGNGGITRERERAAGHAFANWATVRDRIPVDTFVYRADYLILHPPGYEEALDAFVTQKKARGFAVTRMEIPSPNTCENVRAAIRGWAAQVPDHHDAYCLLVGDVDRIPLCFLDMPWNDHWTDDLYASTDGDDLDEEVYLGRLSVDDETDCANQLAKILAYEDSPHETCCYDRVLLWAHKQDEPPYVFERQHESIRLTHYAVAPSFTTLYGSTPGATDLDALALIDDGPGLVAYRGHGNSFCTAAAWNLDDEFFDRIEIDQISCPAPQTPVVWSLACSNNDLDFEDCAGEQWMERVGTGAVAYYAATSVTGPDQNGEINARLFEAVYDLDLLTHAQAIQFAEDPATALMGDNVYWRYMLLGDPDMQVRRRNPTPLITEGPSELVRRPPPQVTPVEIRVLRPGGIPVEGALVALYKPYRMGGESGPPSLLPDDVHVNGYTDADGRVTLHVAPQTPGPLWLSVEDTLGGSRRAQDILVVDGSETSLEPR